MSERLAVIVPVFNEARGITPTLDALRLQDHSDFDIYFVDNASTDASADIIRAYARRFGLNRWHIISEPTKGTGAAADTGMRAAAAAGFALLARTDADCLPRHDWTASIRRALTPVASGGLGLEFVGGELVPRRDEGLNAVARGTLRGAVHLAEAFGRVRPGNHDPEALGPYMMAAGCNLGIRSSVYIAAGGFPRSRIEELHEDRALVNAVRRLTSRYERRRDIVVFGSSRRVQAWGLPNTLLWYKDHAYKPREVDIRDPREVVREPRVARGSIGRARRFERKLLRSAHPIALPIVDAIPGPVTRVPGLGVVVKDAQLLREVLLDTETYRKNGPGSPGDLWTPVLGPSVLLNMEGDEHAQLRRKLAPLFSPGFVAGLVTEALGPATDALRSQLVSGAPVDLVAHARRAASAVISRLVGLADDVVDDAFFRRSAEITGFVSLARPSLTPRQISRAKAVMRELDEHSARAYAGDESTVPGRMRALGLSQAEALGTVGAFVLTGTETLVSFIPRLVAILIDSGWHERLQADRSLVDAAVAEALRVTTPTPIMLRSAAAAGQIGAVRVQAGDRVILGTAWANGALGDFDPVGNPAASLKQLWFGAGVHFCLGAPLAMAQIRLALDALLAVPSLSIVSRKAARGVLIPMYSELVLQGGS